MTIISGAYTCDSIVIAGDSRLTVWDSEGNLKKCTNDAFKVFLIEKHNIGIAHYGNCFANSRIVASLILKFENDRLIYRDNINSTVIKLKSYMWDENNVGDCGFIVAGYDEEKPVIYEVKHDKLDKINNIIPGGFIRGMRNSELKFPKELINRLNEKKLINCTRNYCELYKEKYKNECGGDIDILLIKKDRASFVQHKIFKPRQGR